MKLIADRLDNGFNGEKPLSSSFRVSGRKKHKDDSGSSFLSAKTCETCENVGEILQVFL